MYDIGRIFRAILFYSFYTSRYTMVPTECTSSTYFPMFPTVLFYFDKSFSSTYLKIGIHINRELKEKAIWRKASVS